MRQKFFDGKSWYSPFFIHKLFRYRKFSETQHRRVPLRIFSALWDKNFSTENRDTLLHKVQKSVVELMFDVCKNSLKTNIKTVVLFLTVCKSWSNICSWAKNIPVLAGRLVLLFRWKKFITILLTFLLLLSTRFNWRNEPFFAGSFLS